LFGATNTPEIKEHVKIAPREKRSRFGKKLMTVEELK
jgi:hypothetical protein